MKNGLIILLVIVCLYSGKSFAQSSAATLDVVSWNLEWFGDTFGNGPPNKDLQETNVKKIMRYLDADLYGLVEIVDTMRLRRLVDSLGNSQYGFFISPFCSGNTTGTGSGWQNGQKLAFVYRKSVFTNIIVRGLLRTSSNAYTNWASGRFPYMFSATATINGITKNVNFILIHGKAGSTESDYLRRKGGAEELKDTLDASFSTSYNLIIGDYNDALNTTIYPWAGISSYISIVADSTDEDHYKSITLPLGNAGQSSMINFPNVVDNHVISNEVEPLYFPGSATIRTDVVAIVPQYVSAHTVSDHYPVFSKYNLGTVTSVPNVSASELGIVSFPNPFTEKINIKATKTLMNVQLQLVNMQGQILSNEKISLLNKGTIIQPHLPSLTTGVYFLQVQTKEYKTVVKFMHL